MISKFLGLAQEKNVARRREKDEDHVLAEDLKRKQETIVRKEEMIRKKEEELYQREQEIKRKEDMLLKRERHIFLKERQLGGKPHYYHCLLIYNFSVG